METTATFSVKIIGEDTGHPYDGDFTVKTILTRRENFYADEQRRLIIGPVSNPLMIPSNVQGEAYMTAQLMVRVIKAPKWWTDSNSGLDLQGDENVLGEIYKLAMDKETERKEALKKSAEVSLDKITKKVNKSNDAAKD